jgi:hypothetical protein
VFINWVSICDANRGVEVIIFIFVAVSGMNGVLYLLHSGRQIIQSGLKGAAIRVGLQAGKAVYDRATGRGSDDNKDEDNKDEDTKDGEKKQQTKNNKQKRK